MNILVLFSYGSLTSIDDVAGFYNDIYHGTATEENIAAGIRTYDAHGMADPLGANTARIGQALVKKLREESDETWKVYVANHHTEPSIQTVAEECIKLNPKRIATFSLTPFDSLTGSNAYAKRFTKLFREKNKQTDIIHVAPYCDHDQFVEVLSARAKTAYEWLPESERNQAEIVFTVHSKPGVPKAHQTMISQYETLAKKVADSLPVKNYHLAYRSGKPLPQRWLGPDVLDVIDELHAKEVPAIIFIEALSVIENLEAIQEITTDAINKAKGLGMSAVQSEYLNDSADFVDALFEHLSAELKIETGEKSVSISFK
ncbi:ferrochelatase [Oceanobacillus alkalisoli]|uniref:ferrochelatase n=1 Tax=Oceanobacillus alkalisoli TaxID=2925113 RepID=UPI001F121186|nr:ferrochelatase [Oceanobacillus alkalisoli]MCF3944708.1 ferrochelatase [Oceanobacillus alkalisoli]